MRSTPRGYRIDTRTLESKSLEIQPIRYELSQNQNIVRGPLLNGWLRVLSKRSRKQPSEDSMFGNKARTRTAEPTVIGRGSTIEGTIHAPGAVQVDGHLEGALIADGHVAIGPTGSIIGEIVADDVALRGRVEGRICVRNHLHVAFGGSARGEVRYGTLQVDRGGVIDGSALQGDVDLTITAEPTLPDEPISSMPPALPLVRSATAASTS
jgi:cytoskeletal protein CcmA (bactofilin family)